jgi:hypothetical protein
MKVGHHKNVVLRSTALWHWLKTASLITDSVNAQHRPKYSAPPIHLPFLTCASIKCNISSCLLSSIWSKNGKGKVHPITGHEVPEGESKYSPIVSLPSALHGVNVLHHAPGRFTPRKSLGSHGTAGWVGPRASMDFPVRNGALYRLRGPTPNIWNGRLHRNHPPPTQQKMYRRSLYFSD